MSTQIVDNFKLNVAKPIDSRMVTTGTASRNSLAYIYEGLRVYDLVNKAPYVYIDGSWKQESSSGGGSVGGGAGVGSIPTGTQDRLLKYTSSTTLGDGTIVDKGTYIVPNVGIGMIPATGVALDVNGILKATVLKGAINGSFVDNGTIDNTKIQPGTNDYSLKTINGSVVWTSSNPLNIDIVIANKISDAGTHYLLFSSISNSATGTPIYANNNGTKIIGVKPSTSQILASGDITNDKNAPSYAFSTNTTAGLYGNSNEVGLSFNSKSLLKLDSTKLSIFDTSGNTVLSTGANKVVFISGEFTGTLGVTGQTTLSGALQVNGSSTFTSLSGTTLGVTGQTTLLNLTTTGTTIFNSQVNSVGLNVTGTTQLENLNVTGTTTISSLSLSSTLNVSGLTTLQNLTVNGPATFTNPITGTLQVESLTVNGNITIGSTGYSINYGAAILKSVKVNDILGSSNTNDGLVTCNKIRIRPTTVSKPTQYTQNGYQPGDIIFLLDVTQGSSPNGNFFFNKGANDGWQSL